MKKTDIINPTAIKFPVAAQGNKNTIPLNPTGTQKASIIGGFPDITMTSIADGGIPPEGKDFNGLFYLATDYKAFLQNGGVITFNQIVSDLIGGYPQDAVLIYYKSDTNTFYHVISMIDDNTYNFVVNPAYIDGEKWKYAETDTYRQGNNIFIDNKVISASGKYPYSFNSGNIDSLGDADLIAYSGADVTYNVGNTYPNLTGTKADGQQFTIDSLEDDDVSTLADGDYIKFIGSDDTTDLLKNKITVAKAEPSTPADNDVWINNAVSSLSVKKYIEPNYTEVGNPTITNGILTGASGKAISYTGIDFSSANSFKICGSFKCNGGNGYNQYILAGLGFTYGLYIYQDTGYVAINLSSNGTSFDLWLTGGAYQITYGQKYWYELEFTGTQYKVNYSTDGINYTTASTVNSNVINPLLISSFVNYIGNSADTARYFNGEIDLKDFKVYVDDVLVYTPDVLTNGWQPYDKIPLGKITVESGAVSGVESYPYNIDYIGAGGAMPSLRFDELTVLTSGGEYTAPSNGYFYFGGSESAYFQIGLKNSNLGMQSTGVSGYGAKVFCPIRKGEVITFRYNTAPTQARFIYAQDSESEAI